MKRIVLRNKTAGILSLDFTGFNVDPIAVSIQIGDSQVVTTPLSVVEFRKIPDVSSNLASGDLSLSVSGGIEALN